MFRGARSGWVACDHHGVDDEDRRVRNTTYSLFVELGRAPTAHDVCSEQISVAVRNGQPDNTTLRFHCLVPAVAWWDDIVFT
jgi:hypothetical protein